MSSYVDDDIEWIMWDADDSELLLECESLCWIEIP